MRILLALASAFLWFHLFMTLVINLFVREEGFLSYQFAPFVYLGRYFDSYNDPHDIFLYLLGIFFLLTIIAPLIRPRIFIWPVVVMNLFIIIGSIDLLWQNHVKPFPPASTPYGTMEEYFWIAGRGIFIFFSALFVAFLMPSVCHLIKKMKW